MVQIKRPRRRVYRNRDRSVRMDVARQVRLHWVVVVARHAHVVMNFDVRVPVTVPTRTVASLNNLV